jgi:flagellar biogenesis protein FliO
VKKQTTAPRRRTKRKPAPAGLAAFLAPAAAILKPVLALLLSARIQRRVRRVHLVERLALGNKHSVTVLRVDDREFMVGCTGETMVLLSALGTPSEAAHELPASHLPANQSPAKEVPTKEDLERAFRRVQ